MLTQPGGGHGGAKGANALLDIYAFAIPEFDEPACAKVDFPSNATATGPWSVMPSRQSTSEYLSGNFSDARVDGASTVVFTPNIRESGNYSVTMYTPGCIQDGTCPTRGRVNITGTMATGTRAVQPIATELFQTNDFDKYDQIYSGYVDANSGSFRPSVTLAPSSGQGNVTLVAQRVRFELVSSTGGLNGLYEFNPNLAVADTDFSSSAIDQAGISLNSHATITSSYVQGDVTFVGGNFSSKDCNNILAVSDNKTVALPGGGLNGEVIALFIGDKILYVGGNFSDTNQTGTQGLHNAVAYSIADRTWQPLGAGVNGPVEEIVPLSLNITSGKPEPVISFTGNFDQILPYGNESSIPVEGFAIWVPSRQSWLGGLDIDIPSITGQLTAAADSRGGRPLFAGSLSSQGLSANGAVTLPITGPLGINRLPLKIQPQTPSAGKQKRAINGQNVTGVATGLFDESGNRNLTILGGHFTAKGSDGSTIDNLVFIDGSKSNQVTGLGPGLATDSVFLALAVQQDTLWAGGTISGTLSGANVNGLILYDLAGGSYVQPQPPAFSGTDVAVNAIATRPNSGDVYVGGNFESAGSLGCPSVCIFTTSASQWNRPGDGISGSVGAMTWADANRLVVGGNLTVNNTATSMATYDVKSRQWTAFTGAKSIPGPVTALSAADDDVSRFWIAGASTNGSAFLMTYDGSTFHSVGDTLGKTTRIRGLQVLSLSKNHDQNDLLDPDQILLVAGQLDLPGFGNVSAALFNGTTFTPFVLSSSGNNGPGSLAQFVSQKQDFFQSSGKVSLSLAVFESTTDVFAGRHLAVGFVVLIGLAIALALIFILVVIGIIAERIRRRREGYLPAPTQMFEKNENLDRIPPSHLFNSFGQRGRGPGGAPMI